MIYVKTNGELYHHGVLGQKWGVKNGPPYPLKPSAHSASEKKAGWTKSVSGDAKKKKTGKTGGFFQDRAAKKQKREEDRKIWNDYINANIDYGNEYDKTPEGKKTKAAYDKVLDWMYSTYKPYEDWTPAEKKAYEKAEKDYLFGREKYSVSKYRKGHSDEDIIRVVNASWNAPRVDNIDDAVSYLEDMWRAHTE